MWRTVGRIAVVTLVWCTLALAAAATGLSASTADLVGGIGAGLTFFGWAWTLARGKRHVEEGEATEPVAPPMRRRASV
jgi:hypothetical protein